MQSFEIKQKMAELMPKKYAPKLAHNFFKYEYLLMKPNK